MDSSATSRVDSNQLPTEYTSKSVREFCDLTASAAPVPGGGSVAANVGALAAALVSMVCNLTIGKQKYAEVEDEIATLRDRTEELRTRLLNLVDADIAAYSVLSSAMRMPKDTDDEKSARTRAMQSALVEAAEVPLRIAECCGALLPITVTVAAKGNTGVLSDAGVAAWLAASALKSAAVNVRVNLALLKDQATVLRLESALRSVLTMGTGCVESVERSLSERSGLKADEL